LDETILHDESKLPNGEASSLEGNISSRVGARVRAAREDRGESLRAFAARAGVSASMLSDVERGAKSPTIAILSSIAEGLGMPLSSLVSEEHPLEAGPRIIRAADMPLVVDPESTIERYHLGPVITESKIEFLRFILPPGSSTGNSSEHEHGTIERVYVVRGRVEVIVGGKRFTLGPGDAAVYRASVAHGLHAPPDEAAEVYLVIERP
jgi:transcriptional regulator with XRE-family HTH domain